jgi:DNA repair exonuclease SbcCD nuclease subunit
VTNQEAKPIRILHAADIHLGERDSANTGGLDDRGQHALKALVDLSIRARTSLVIIAGDLFDHNRVDPRTVDFAVRELLRALVPVVILPGNHDCLIPDSVYRQASFSELTPIVRVFTSPEGERFSFPELDLAVWGKPITSYEADHRPMAAIPPRGKERWQIAVAHGYYVGVRNDQIYSLQISEEEIVQSSHDYVALGHWGAFRCVCDEPVKAYYPGSASGTGTVAIVDLLDKVGVQVHSHPLAL